MEDIILMDSEQTEYEQIDIFDPVSENKQDIDNIEKFEKVEEERIDEREQIDKSDSIILGSNDINNMRSAKSINVNHFDSISLWANNTPNNVFNGQNVSLTDSISNYDYIAIRYKGLTSSEAESVNIISVDDFRNSTGLNVRFSAASAYDYVYVRVLTYVDDLTINISDCYVINTAQNSICIPLEIYGLTYKVGQNIPDNPSIPSVSGNTVNNYYITVSSNDASLSYNLLNKPLNNYSVSESILLFLFMGLFVAGFSWFIKKNIFKL